MIKKEIPLYLGVACLAFFTEIHAFADSDIIVNDGNNGSVIEGVITDITFDEATLALDNGAEIEVDIDNLDLDEDRFDEYFPEGSRVQIIGEFSDDEFKAESILKDSSNNVIITPGVY